MKRLQEIETRKAEIRDLLNSEEQVDIEALDTELRELDTEKQKIEKRKKIAETINVVENVEEIGGKKIMNEERTENVVAEQRGQALKEKRSVTIASTGVILPQHQATDIKGTFNEVSTLLDRVNVKALAGGESFKQPYVAGYGEGGYTTEGGNPATAETTFGYAEITKTKIASYAEDSEELVKLPAANYDMEVQKGVRESLRKKLTKEILIGDGAAGHFIGIFDDGATAIDAATDKEIKVIDEKTLDEIIYSFGGNEDVEDIAVLILNKKDLKEFATLRNTDGKKVYDVRANGNVGTIDGVPFIINSNCKALADAVAGDYVMAYGPLSNYTMAVFSDVEITRSTDYKFKEGMICHRGVVFAGGNVTAKNGFLRVKKGA